MTSHHSGLVKQVQAVSPAAVWKHCMIYCWALATQNAARCSRWDNIRIVNLINLLSILCNAMGVHFQQLLLHSEVQVLTHLCDAWGSTPLPHLNQLPTCEAHRGYHLGYSVCLSFWYLMISILNTPLRGKECHIVLAHERSLSFIVETCFYVWRHRTVKVQQKSWGGLTFSHLRSQVKSVFIDIVPIHNKFYI